MTPIEVILQILYYAMRITSAIVAMPFVFIYYLFLAIKKTWERMIIIAFMVD